MAILGISRGLDRSLISAALLTGVTATLALFALAVDRLVTDIDGQLWFPILIILAVASGYRARSWWITLIVPLLFVLLWLLRATFNTAATSCDDCYSRPLPTIIGLVLTAVVTSATGAWVGMLRRRQQRRRRRRVREQSPSTDTVPSRPDAPA